MLKLFIRWNCVALVSGILLASSLSAQNQRLQFKGSVVATDATLPFESPIELSSTLKAKVGDRVLVTLHLDEMNPKFVLNPRDGAAMYQTGIVVELELNENILTGNDPFGGTGVQALVMNEGAQIFTNIPGEGNVILPDTNPLVSGEVDAFILTINPGGYFEGGKLIHTGVLVNGEVDERLSLILNFTDPSGTAFRSQRFPETVPFDSFSLAKGFLSLGPGGILFELNQIQMTDGEQETEGLSTGFNVSWPSQLEGYVLEVAEFSSGPWIRHEGVPFVVEGQNIVVMDMQARSKFYRLTKEN